MKRAPPPPPVVAGNVTLHWMPQTLTCLGGYPLPGGKVTQDREHAQEVAEYIAAISRPLPPVTPDERMLRDRRWGGIEV